MRAARLTVPRPLGRLGQAALVAALFWLTLFNLYQIHAAFPRKLVESDFRIWYAAASIGTHLGWSHLYDLAAQKAAVEAVWSGSRFLAYGDPPVAAWIVWPLTLVPFGVALAIWSMLSLAVLVAFSQAFAPADRLRRVIYALSALGFLPTFVMVEAAPLSPIVFAAIGACALLLIRGKNLAAGAVLSLIMVKLNLALLVPPALLVAGYLRSVGAFVGTSALLGLAQLAAVGVQGTRSMIAIDMDFFADPYHLTYSLEVLFGSRTAWLIAAAVISVLTLAAAYLTRTRGPHGPIAAGIAGSLLINHHLTPADFIMLLLAIWLVLSLRPRVEIVVAGAALWTAGWATSLGLAWPVAVMEAVFIGAVATISRNVPQAVE